MYEIENMLSSRIIEAQHKTSLKAYNDFILKQKNARSGIF
jgi:hypothetical protein